MTTITITHTFAADATRAATRRALLDAAAQAGNLALTLSRQRDATFPVAAEPGDAADELFYASETAIDNVWHLAGLIRTAASAL